LKEKPLNKGRIRRLAKTLMEKGFLDIDEIPDKFDGSIISALTKLIRSEKGSGKKIAVVINTLRSISVHFYAAVPKNPKCLSFPVRKEIEGLIERNKRPSRSSISRGIAA
jgi:hypothetical protein